ncbi:MAG TPA: DUF6223 family protein [Amycolatopsis sp.]|uniref:DUF6223 family protein n=1 Tax=Amycolatopsis nalaikhensis TaxID=715472 RepID=A0ABY8XSA6_9PSEU|nr:DUF6223 family protein [Amycolatopsis sp. 2-2]WIV58517.1 DUF6223 family protein [Amycolatopsis sp. 2-2]
MSVHLAAVSAYTLTAGRLWSVVAAVVGVAGIVIGWLALTGRAGSGRTASMTAVVLGVAGAIGGGAVVAAAKGGPGTGYGIVGGYLALLVGVVAAGLGAWAIVRARRGFVGGRR